MAKKSDSKKGLGRGLSALLADAEQIENAAPSTVPPDTTIPIDKIYANSDQPRRTFVKSELEDLSNSIAEKGIIQPLILRFGKEKGTYEIVAGERRWRAAQMAKLHEVPAVVRELDESEALEIAIIENMQRADLNPIEEAAGLQQLVDKFGHTQEKLSQVIGKSRSHIANLMRLLKLPSDVLELVRDQKLSAGHARVLVGNENASKLAAEIVGKDLSVRQTEALVKSPKKSKPLSEKKQKDADTLVLEDDLSAALKMKVSIEHRDEGNGSLKISYKSLEQLDQLCQKLSH